jgi:hypothetical protein
MLNNKRLVFRAASILLVSFFTSACSWETDYTKYYYFSSNSYYYFTLNENGEKIDGNQYIDTSNLNSYFVFDRSGTYIEHLTFVDGTTEIDAGSYYSTLYYIFLVRSNGEEWQMGRYSTGTLCSYTYYVDSLDQNVYINFSTFMDIN